MAESDSGFVTIRAVVIASFHVVGKEKRRSTFNASTSVIADIASLKTRRALAVVNEISDGAFRNADSVEDNIGKSTFNAFLGVKLVASIAVKTAR